jgi:hypothetical protein
MAKHIIHGIGRLILKDFADPTKIIAYSDLQNFSLESNYTADDITGGNKIAPIASFKQDQTVDCSATNATFDEGIIAYTDGATLKTGVKTLTDFIEVAIPEDGIITLPVVPTSVSVAGFEASESVTAGAYKLAADEKTVTFSAEDAGKVVVIVYSFNSTAEAIEYGVTQVSMPKPFIAEYVFDIYDENAQITHKCYITVFKAQCTSGLKLDLAHRTAFAPEFAFSARDPKRQDGKLWEFVLDKVVAE